MVSLKALHVDVTLANFYRSYKELYCKREALDIEATVYLYLYINLYFN